MKAKARRRKGSLMKGVKAEGKSIYHYIWRRRIGKWCLICCSVYRKEMKNSFFISTESVENEGFIKTGGRKMKIRGICKGEAATISYERRRSIAYVILYPIMHERKKRKALCHLNLFHKGRKNIYLERRKTQYLLILLSILWKYIFEKKEGRHAKKKRKWSGAQALFYILYDGGRRRKRQALMALSRVSRRK